MNLQGIELLKCPFCGSEDVELTPSFHSADYVECRDCWAHGPIIGTDMRNKELNRKKAWNKRECK